MRLRFGSMPWAQCSSNERMPSASRRALCRKLWAISGLNTFSSKLPWAPPTVSATSLPNTWQHSIVMASHWVGLTLPGMIELPGSFSGIVISPRPERGPDAIQRTSLAIFISAVARVLNAPCASTSASWPASAMNLFGADLNCRPVRDAISAAMRLANSGCAFRPVPTAVPPAANCSRPGRAFLIACSANSSCAT